MKASSFISAGKVVVLICFTLFVVLPVFVAMVWWAQDWRYTRFCWRGQRHYSQVAEACDQVLAAGQPIPREIRGKQLGLLPPVLRELNVSRVLVDTNVVMVVVGGGWMTHHIIWAPAEDCAGWNLITGSPEARNHHVIYSRPMPANQRIEPMTGSAFRLDFNPSLTSALPVMAHS